MGGVILVCARYVFEGLGRVETELTTQEGMADDVQGLGFRVSGLGFRQSREHSGHSR